LASRMEIFMIRNIPLSKQKKLILIIISLESSSDNFLHIDFLHTPNEIVVDVTLARTKAQDLKNTK